MAVRFRGRGLGGRGEKIGRQRRGATRKNSAMRRSSSVLAAGGAMLVCSLLLTALHTSPTELSDKEAAEIAKLQAEKNELERSLKTGRMPLLHPEVLKSEVRRAAQLKSNVHRAPVQKLSQQAPVAQAKPPVQQLEAERKALENKIHAFQVQAKKQKDPLMGGILAAYKEDTGAGVLSRTHTLHDANQGLLGRVGEAREADNVLGSLAATMTKVQQEKMLEAEHVRQLDNVAKAMGDVTPKEALAQRIISLGKEFLKMKDSPHHVGPTAAKAHVRASARGRVAQKHARLEAARSAHHDAGALPSQSKGSANTHSQIVSAAKKRVELLRKELKEAQRVAQLQAQLQKEQEALSQTHAKETKFKKSVGVARTQHLVAKLPGADEGANEKFDNANDEITKFVGKKMAEDEDDDAEDEADPSMEKRFQKKAHGEGYIKKAIYVGTPEEGPDRYGQDGAGPQTVKGKLGDNFVDVGLMGAAGTLEGDVMVPTKLSGVRHRDSPQGNDPKKMSLGHVDKETSDDIVKGTLVDDFGGEAGMQVDDKSVPIDKVRASLFRDRARTQDLAQTR